MLLEEGPHPIFTFHPLFKTKNRQELEHGYKAPH